jgi:hypothetical protein
VFQMNDIYMTHSRGRDEGAEELTEETLDG